MKKHRSQNETVSLPRSSFLLHLFKASVLHATGLRDRPPGAHVHLHDGAFLLIEAAGGTMHCIWPSRFLRCRHGGAFPFVSAFHFSLSLRSRIKAMSPPSQIHSISWRTIKAWPRRKTPNTCTMRCSRRERHLVRGFLFFFF